MNAPALRPFKAKPARAKPVDREGQELAALMKELQLRYPQALADQGYLAIVCRGNIDAVEAIRAYLLQPATVAA